MKKLTLSVLTAFLLLSITPTQLKAERDTIPTVMVSPKTAESEKADYLIARLDEINAMDKSNLSSKERKHLRKEVRSIKKELRELGRGVYLSVGAIIIIILLLILLL